MKKLIVPFLLFIISIYAYNNTATVAINAYGYAEANITASQSSYIFYSQLVSATTTRIGYIDLTDPNHPEVYQLFYTVAPNWEVSLIPGHNYCVYISTNTENSGRYFYIEHWD